MKILMINSAFTEIGGAEVYIASLSDILNDKGHTVFHFAIDKDKELISEKLFIYKDSYKRSISKYFLWYYFNPFLFFRLKKWIRSIDPDIVHIHNNGKFTLTILLAIYFSHIPAVQTIHDYSFLCPIGSFVLKTGKVCNKGFGRCCSKNGCISWFRYYYEVLPVFITYYFQNHIIKLFIVPSTALLEALTKKLVRTYYYLPNFIKKPSIEISTIRPKTEPIILFVGRLVESKGILTFIDSIPLILKKNPNCIFLIIGDGPLKELIIKKCSTSEISSNVRILGWIANADLKDYYDKASLLVLPSIAIEAGNPLTALEGMAFGLPIVASNRGGFVDVIEDGKNGFLIEPGNSGILAETVQKILNDESLMNTMMHMAIEKSTIYCDYEGHYKKLNDLYLSVIKNSKRK